MHTDDLDNEPASIDDLRVLMKEIGELWQAGDNTIVGEARKALWQVIHASAAKLRKELDGTDTTIA